MRKKLICIFIMALILGCENPGQSNEDITLEVGGDTTGDTGGNLIVDSCEDPFIDINIDFSGGDLLISETYGDQSKLLEESEGIWLTGVSSADRLISVDIRNEYQEIEGFGAALTDSSAYLIYYHPQKEEILQSLFNKESGAAINYLRVTLGSSDFSRTWYTYADEESTDLNNFSMEMEDEYLFPLLNEILTINPDVKIMATPWTAPGWMKKNSSGTKNMIGGVLDPDHYNIYADYLIKCLDGYSSRGIVIDTLTLQNEPLHSTAPYPCMKMTAENQADLVKVLGPKLDQTTHDTKVLIWDHNWNVSSYPSDVMELLDAEEKHYVAGSAWHGYMGVPEGMSIAYDLNPELDIYFSEITGGQWSTSFMSNLRWNYDNIVIGGMRNWAKTVLLWNLALREDGTPNIRPEPTGDGDIMRGVLTLDENSYDKEVEYYILGQVAKYIERGAVRLGSNEICEDNNILLKSVAFKNPDGTMVLVVSNNNWTYNSLDFDIQYGNYHFSHSLPKESVVVFTW